MSDQDFQETVLESLSRLETQARENNARVEQRLNSLENRFCVLERDVGWIKGKLEGSQEVNKRVLAIFPLCTAVGAALIVLLT